MKWTVIVVIVCSLYGARAAPQLLPRLDGRIVGGKAVNIEEIPYQASLQYYVYHICGASIITHNYVLTAAHCINGMPASVFTVRASSSHSEEGGQVVQVAEVIQHPQYVKNSADYDVAVLRLAGAFSLNMAARPVVLASYGEDVPIGTKAVVSGWGRLKEDGMLPIQLQAVTVSIISKSQCEAGYGYGAITDRMICAGQENGGKDACQGDSGGPLVSGGVQIGIVSWGHGCAKPTYPGVYTNVADVRSFIKIVSGI